MTARKPKGQGSVGNASSARKANSAQVKAAAKERLQYWASRRGFVRTAGTLLIGALYFGIGTLFYMRIEGWDAIQSLYFLMVTASTVGYGDVSPGSDQTDEWKQQYLGGSRAFTVVYLFIGVVIVFAQVSTLIADALLPMFKLSRSWVEASFPQVGIDLDGDGSLDFKLPRSRLVYYGKQLTGPILFSAVVQLLCATVFTWLEPGMDFGTATYHCIVTATTVGYGDVSLTTDGSRVWAFFHILISVSVLAAIISDVDELAEQRRLAMHKLTLLRGTLDFELMKSLDLDGNGVDKFEFVFGMLKKLEVISEEDVRAFSMLFEKMDRDASGLLTPEDLQDFATSSGHSSGRASPLDAESHPAHPGRSSSSGKGGGSGDGQPRPQPQLSLKLIDSELARQKRPPQIVLFDMAPDGQIISPKGHVSPLWRAHPAVESYLTAKATEGSARGTRKKKKRRSTDEEEGTSGPDLEQFRAEVNRHAAPLEAVGIVPRRTSTVMSSFTAGAADRSVDAATTYPPSETFGRRHTCNMHHVHDRGSGAGARARASPYVEPHDSAEKEEEEEWEEEEEEEEEEESSEHFPADFVGTPQTARGAERI